jgi:fatty-acyl-CoA synthase
MADAILLPDWISYHAKTSPSSTACKDLYSGRAYTYAELDDRISRLADALTTIVGVSPGDRVLVLSRNDIDVFEIQFACQRTAAIFVPLNWRLALDELETIANDARPAVLFCGVEFGELAAKLSSCTRIPHLVDMNSGRPSKYESWLSRSPAKACAAAPRGGDDVWALLYTSGTTGTPKGTQITYRMVFCNTITLGSMFRITSESCNIVVLLMIPLIFK